MTLAVFPDGPLKPLNNLPDPYDEWTSGAKDRERARRQFMRSKLHSKRRRYRLPIRRPKPSSDRQEYYRTVYLKTEHWKKLRGEKLAANPACEKCGSTQRTEPHHLRYKQLYNVLVSDLMTLCRRCHILEHKKLDAQRRVGKLPMLDKNERGLSRRE